jgi:hypothetical protein
LGGEGTGSDGGGVITHVLEDRWRAVAVGDVVGIVEVDVEPGELVKAEGSGGFFKAAVVVRRRGRRLRHFAAGVDRYCPGGFFEAHVARHRRGVVELDVDVVVGLSCHRASLAGLWVVLPSAPKGISAAAWRSFWL